MIDTGNNGTVYEGDFKDGEFSGYGTAKYKNLDQLFQTYKGYFKNGKREGVGTLIWEDGKRYIGHFKEGKFCGQGSFRWDTGETHDGEFQNDLQHGPGIFTWNNGDSYKGSFEEGVFSGMGELRYSSGTVYTGMFKNGTKDGYGKYVWSTGDIHEGEWRSDLKHGPGKYTWHNKNSVVGEWKNDLRVGGHFFEYLTGNNFNYPTLDQDPEIYTEILSPRVKSALTEEVCTFLKTEDKHYFQYMWNVEAEERLGVCSVCKIRCIPNSLSRLKEPQRRIFGGNFICSCGQGLLKSPCRSLKKKITTL